MSNNPNNVAVTDGNRNWLEVVRQQVESLRFGTVGIVVHDGRVTQIERTERLRFEKGNAQIAHESRGSKKPPEKQ